MSFIEKLGKKLTDAGQGISQQTRNLADTARLNASINDRKKQVSAGYASLAHERSGVRVLAGGGRLEPAL